MGIFSRKPNIRKLKERRDVEGLIGALSHKDEEIREDAVEALGEVGDKRAVQPLMSVLEVIEENKSLLPPIFVQRAAINALGKTGDVRAVKTLAKALKYGERTARFLAIKALGNIKDKEGLEPLIQALKDKDYAVRWRAVKSLEEIKAVDPLILALKQGDYVVRFYAVKALGDMGDTRAVKSVTQALRVKDEDIRKVAEEALGNIRGKSKKQHRKAEESFQKPLFLKDYYNILFTSLTYNGTYHAPDGFERSEGCWENLVKFSKKNDPGFPLRIDLWWVHVSVPEDETPDEVPTVVIFCPNMFSDYFDRWIGRFIEQLPKQFMYHESYGISYLPQIKEYGFECLRSRWFNKAQMPEFATAVKHILEE